MGLRKFFDLLAQGGHLNSIVQANEVKEQNAEKEDGRGGQNCANQVCDGDQKVVADGDKQNGGGTEHPKPGELFPQTLAPNQFKDQQNDDNAGGDGEDLLAWCHRWSPPRYNA